MSVTRTLFAVVADVLVSRLQRALPELGGKHWWETRVRQQLSSAQVRVLADVSPGDLQALDAGALLRLAERNWSELPLPQVQDGDSRLLLLELRQAWQQGQLMDPACGSVEDDLRLVGTARRFLRALGAADAAEERLGALQRELALRLSGQGEPASAGGGQGGLPGAKAAELAREGQGGWLVGASRATAGLVGVLGETTFVGIDFGTSTSVVSVVGLDATGRLVARTLPIRQPDEYGGTINHHLVNTVLAWKNERLLFGVDAHRLRQELFEGKSIFSSFKMRLGINLGPTWPETALSRHGRGPVIETARDATTTFFRLLAEGIREAVRDGGLPSRLRFAVTVPASFEANQRRDLLECMNAGGLEVTESCLIDEPNAAFLSQLHEATGPDGDRRLADTLSQGPAHVLVYDFGAGTCDVSVLAVALEAGGLKSRNVAISRFTALGGDDIDRAIARDVLLPDLLASCPQFKPEQRDLEERILPRLQPTAERLKLAAVRWFTERGLTEVRELAEHETLPFTDHALPDFVIRKQTLSLPRPSLTLAQLAKVLRPFVGRHESGRTPMHVYGPVADALGKSGLSPEDLDAVLFIGGSAANPVVRKAVMCHLPDTVEAIVPSDLRTHVSLGAALHALGFHHFGHELIRPITPEPIFIVTRGGRLERIVPASSEVPSPRAFETHLMIARGGQKVLELPVCVSNENKMLGLLRIDAPHPSGFRAGAEVSITAAITRDKLLEIEVRMDTLRASSTLLNPLANRELGPEETALLEARQAFNEALLEHRGKPPAGVVVDYAEAALEAEAWEIAAEMFTAAERLNPRLDFASNICYAYSWANRKEQARTWARTAYERNRNALSAFNLSCHEKGAERERLLNEALTFDPEFTPALLALGESLVARSEPRGRALLEQCLEIYGESLADGSMTRGECHGMIRAAEALGRRREAKAAKARLHRLQVSDSLYDEENLAAAKDPHQMVARG